MTPGIEYTLHPIPRSVVCAPPQSLPAGPHPVVLVGSDCSETCLLEYKGFEVLLCIFFTIFAWVHVDNMEARLVSVHGVENNLEGKMEDQLQQRGWD